MPPCHEADITSVDTKLSGREWEGKRGGKKGECKGFYQSACFTNLLISKMTTAVLSKGNYLQGNWQFAAPEPIPVLVRISLLLKYSKKELHQMLAPPALTRTAPPPAPAFRGSVCTLSLHAALLHCMSTTP